MNRTVIALACAGLLVLAAAACSSGGDSPRVVSTEVDETTTTTDDDTTGTTAPDDDTSTTVDDGAVAFTAEQRRCILDEVQRNPALGAYSSDQDLIETGSQADKETFYTILVECAGREPLVESFMTGFTSSTAMDDAGLACVRAETEALSDRDLVLLKSGDPTVATDLTAAITASCI